MTYNTDMLKVIHRQQGNRNMHMTRPYFPGYTALSRIVDNENTISNMRKEKEEKEEIKRIKASENRKNHKNKNYMVTGGIPISKNLVDNFYETGDIVQAIKTRNRTSKNILNHDLFVEELINDSEYVNCLTNLLKFAINKNIDSSLHQEVAQNYVGSVINSKMIRAYKNVYNKFLANELEMRRKGTM